MGKELRIADNWVEEALRVLRDAGCRITRGRRTVLEVLSNSRAPLTAPELFAKIEKDPKAPAIDRVSVYRVLETLQHNKLVHQIAPSGAYISCRHQGCSHEAHFLTNCTKCGEVSEDAAPQSIIAPVIKYLDKELGFTPNTHTIFINDLCKRCVN